MVELYVVKNEDDEPLPSLGHNGPPPDVLPPCNARPSETDAELRAHLDELMAVAQARAGRMKWGARLDRATLYPLATAIETAKRLAPSEETAARSRRRLTLKHLREELEGERDWNVHVASVVDDPELAASALAKFDAQMALFPVFENAPRCSTFPFIAREVIRAVDAMNSCGAAPPISAGWGGDGIVVALVACALRLAGSHKSDEAVRSALAVHFKGK